jgi:hypothetical protein
MKRPPNLAVPIGELTPDQAAAVVDLIDRGGMDCDEESYQDLLLVASGHGELVRQADTGKARIKPHAVCTVCGKGFDALRPKSAKYCSPACRGKGTRARCAAKSPKTGVAVSQLEGVETTARSAQNTRLVEAGNRDSCTVPPLDSEDVA